MKRFQNILMVYNDAVGDDEALTQAANLARRNAARLTLIEVVSEPSSDYLQSERRKHLARIAVSISREDIAVETVVHTGIPFLRIIQKVLRDHHDLVIMSAERSGGLRALFFGTTSMHLMRKCPCPVWIIKPDSCTTWNRVLAAIDPAPAGTEADNLNVKIMDLATSLARLDSSELHIVHAWELTGRDLDTSSSEVSDDTRSELLRKNEFAQRRQVDNLVKRYALDDLQHDVHVPYGDPAFLLPRLIVEKAIDIVVMGTVRRTGIAGFLIGSTAEAVLRQVECTVLTAKPDKFVTPVTI